MAAGRKTGGRRKGVPNKVSAKIMAEARATGKFPHEISLDKAREFRERELAFRRAANDPNVAPELQATYLRKADKLAIDGQVFCRDAAPYYAPRLSAVRMGGDANAPLGGNINIRLIDYKAADLK